MRAVLRPAFEENEIPRPIDMPVIVDDLALDYQKLFMTRMIVRLAGRTRRHPVDVKARTFRKRVIELKEALSMDSLAIDNKRLEGRIVDVNHLAFCFFDLAHSRFLVDEVPRKFGTLTMPVATGVNWPW
jgi:hypothetical protein